MLLIFPTEVGFDKRKLPFVTLTLILANLLCFFIFQLDDPQEEQQVMEYYERSGLFNVELPMFEKYLQTPAGQKHYRGVSNVHTEGPSRIYFMVFDQDFRYYLVKTLDTNNSDDAQQWRWLAVELENKKSEVTSYAYGARPDNLRYWPVFTHMFLHGDIGHLIGNMVFLLLFGIGVERLFGGVKYLVLYVSAGMVGAIVFNFLDGKPYMPLVGASGAISGLMGAYAAYFGLQKIRFFAWFGFYFNQYKWPAIVVLAFWIIKELLSQITETESNVAYLAHFGGLVCGGLLGFILRPRQRVSGIDLAPADVSEEQKLYRKALEHIRKLELDEARWALDQTLEHAPWHIEALKSLYNLDKVNPGQPSYKNTINRIFSYDLHREAFDAFVLTVANEALPHHIEISDLTIDAFFGLLHRWLRNDRVQSSEPYIKQAKKVFAENEKLPKLLFEWSIALARRNKIRTASIELNYLANYYGETPHGKAARAELKRWKS